MIVRVRWVVLVITCVSLMGTWGCGEPPPSSDEVDPLPKALSDFDPASIQPGSGHGRGGGTGAGGGRGAGGGQGTGRTKRQEAEKHGTGKQDGTGGGKMDGSGGGNQKANDKNDSPETEPAKKSETEKGD